MTLDFNAPGYGVGACWRARRETSIQIAKRFQDYLKSLGTIDPLLENWRFATDAGWRMYRGDVALIEKFVIESVCKDDYGEPEAEFGYGVQASTPIAGPRGFGILGHAGGWIPPPFTNRVSFVTAFGFHPDLDCIRYDLFRSVLLATVAAWSPFACSAWSTRFLKPSQNPPPYGAAWIQYVPPDLADNVETRDVPFVEKAPDGGLLLSATTETFDVDNPDHMAGARAIGRATAHLDWPEALANPSG